MQESIKGGAVVTPCMHESSMKGSSGFQQCASTRRLGGGGARPLTLLYAAARADRSGKGSVPTGIAFDSARAAPRQRAIRFGADVSPGACSYCQNLDMGCYSYGSRVEGCAPARAPPHRTPSRLSPVAAPRPPPEHLAAHRSPAGVLLRANS